jgi:hypothetical protein
MVTRLTSRVTAVLALLFCGTTAKAEIITYFAEFAQSGDVLLGSTLDWSLYAQISDSDSENLGIESAAVDLLNSTGETMTPGTIGSAFDGYNTTSGGTPMALGRLTNIHAVDPATLGVAVGKDPSNGGSLGPILLANGSYQVNTLGLHTLETVFSGFTLPSQYISGSDDVFPVFNYNQRLLGPGDSVNVVAGVGTPEPASLAMMSLLAGPGIVVALRRRRKAAAQPA